MGFWGTLGKIGGIAAGFIPGVGPIASSLIGMGAGALGGFADSKGNKSATGSGNAELDTLIAGQSAPNSNFSQARSTLAPAKNYFSKALSGDPEALQDLLGPEISTVLGQYDAAAKTATELGPRGGGRNAVLAAAPFQKAATYGKALAGARSGAAKGLTDVAQVEGAMAGSEASNKGNLIASLLSRQNSKDQLAFQKSTQNNQAIGDIGAGLGGILVDLLNKKKGGGGSGGVDLSGVFSFLK